MNRKVLIKKYENRRLYDTSASRYINLEEVAQMVKEGRNIQVLDAATGKDLTRMVLTQIIVEDAKAPDSAFPLDILRQMVIASGKATQENTLKYMKMLLDMYQNAYRVMAPPLGAFDFMHSPGARPMPAESLPGSGPEAKPSAEVEELRQRVRELEVLVSRLGEKETGARKAQQSRRSRR